MLTAFCSCSKMFKNWLLIGSLTASANADTGLEEVLRKLHPLDYTHLTTISYVNKMLLLTEKWGCVCGCNSST